MRIVQMNEHKDIIKTIILDDSSEEDDLIIPDPQNATIEYKQEFALSNQSFSMTVQSFLDHGFDHRRDVVDTKYLQNLAQLADVTITKFVFWSNNGDFVREIPYSTNLHEIYVSNKNLCSVIYDAQWGDKNASIRLDKLLSRKRFPQSMVNTLSLASLEQCFGYSDLRLVGFQGDKYTTKVLPLAKDDFIEYEYSLSKRCFVYYSPDSEPETTYAVRLDHLLERGYFPHTFMDASQLFETQHGDNDHAPAQDSLHNNYFLKMTQEIHDFLYSFKARTCQTCKNRWFVADKPVPGNTQLDILNPRKNKSSFQFSLTDGSECDRCRRDVPLPGLPKMFSAENGMDFGPTFPTIDSLTTMQEMLVARVSTLVSVVTLTSTGYLSYQGHSVNFMQKTTEWFNTIPRRVSACEILLIVRKGAPAAQKRKAFKVSRTRLLAAVKTLAEVNPHYSPDKVNIDWDYLNSLPEDDVPCDANIIEKEMNEGAFRHNIGRIQCHNEDGSLSVFFDEAIYLGGCSTRLTLGEEVEINTTQFGMMKGVVSQVEDAQFIKFNDIFLPFNPSCLHVQSKRGCQP